jgi:hypothetical protein
MNRSHECRTSVAALRPWPFGPPLRGRASRHDAGPLAAICRGKSARYDRTPSGHTRVQALAPVGGLACLHRTCCVR